MSILRFGIHVIWSALCVTLAAGGAQLADPVPSTVTPDGLKGKVYFISPTMSLPNLDRLEPVGTIYTNPLFVKFREYTEGFPGVPDRFEWFAIDYTGKIYVRKPGTYRFRLASDDGSKLYIDGQLLINADPGPVLDPPKSMPIKLSGGMHRIRLSYFQGPRYHLALMLSVAAPRTADYRPFDTRDFSPPTRPEDWKYGSPADFYEPPDPDVGRVKLKDVIADQGGTSNKDLLELVRSAIQLHTPDQSLAKTLSKLTLSQKLDPVMIEELQSEGAGQEAVAALDRLRETSAGLPVDSETTAFQFPARPSIEEQTRFFHSLSSSALHYTATLPDFICTETVRRYTALLRPPPETAWKPEDVLTVKLTYFGNKEKYELTLVNGDKTTRGYESAGGALSEGDFGTQLLEIFSQDTETKFQWDHWTRLRNRLTQVYSYRTLLEHSHYRLAVGMKPNDRRTAATGRHGFVYADNETHMVMRVIGEADSIPSGFPVKAQSSTLDYGLVDIGGRQFIVPLRSEQHMQTEQVQFMNVEEFDNYRKFTGDSSISFDAPDR